MTRPERETDRLLHRTGKHHCARSGFLREAHFFVVSANARPELPRDPRFETNPGRVTNNDALTPLIEEAIADLDGSALCYALLAAKVPAGLVQSIPEALSHPHTIHRDMVLELDGYRWTGIPVKLSDTSGKVSRPPPEFNQHADEVLAEHGFSSGG